MWFTFLSEARDREIFQALRYTKPRRKEPTPDITFQGTTATTFKEKASVFRQARFPAPPVSQVREDADPISHTLPWPKVTTDEIQNAIRSSFSTKAPGPRQHRIRMHQDGIQRNPRILQYPVPGTIPGRIPPSLLATSNHCYPQEGGKARL